MDDIVKNHRKVKTSSNRSFGFVFAAFFLIIALLPLRKHGDVRIWALAVSLTFLIVSLLWDKALSPLNKAWTKFGFLLHKITNPIILGIIFFFIFTPMAILIRLMGKAKLASWKDPTLNSYWTNRIPPGPSGESLKNQF